MNILSLISFSVFILFVLLGFYSLKLNRNSTLNIFAFIECIILSVWAFAYTFFYVAPTPEDAMFWHKIGCIGGSLFPPFAVYFFLILTNRNRYFKHFWQYFLFYTFPVIILAKNLMSQTTCLAISFVQSTSGLGWTYNNSPANIWTWIYVLYLAIYFGFGFCLLFLWRKESQYKNQKRQALIIILVDTVVLIIGLTTDIFLPLFNHFIPPMANISTILFAIGFFILISQYQLLSFSKIASPDIILETVMDPVLLLDENGKIIRYNDATYEMLKYEKNEMTNRSLNSLFASVTFSKANLEKLIKDNKIESQEIDLVAADGRIINTIVSASVAKDSIDGFMGIVVSFHDITTRKKNEEALLKSRENYRRLADELYYLANYDALTNLPNRRLFFVRLKEFCQEYFKSGKDFAVIFLDLNEFKEVNDRYGHDIGDQVLVETARRLKSILQEDEVLSRMGGDEFTIITNASIRNSEESDPDIIELISQIKSAFSESFIVNNLSLNLSISAGHALFSASDHHLDVLMRNADQMMYQDKRNSI